MRRCFQVVNDAAGNASGWLVARLMSFLLVAIVVSIQPYHNDLQYGTTQPALILIITGAFSVGLNYIFTVIEVRNVHRLRSRLKVSGKPRKKKPSDVLAMGANNEDQTAKVKEIDKIDKFLDKYASGYIPTVCEWLLGYFTYDNIRLAVFIASKSQSEKDRLRCTDGFTAFTPNYPEADSIHEIMGMTPYSLFGLAIMVLAFFIASLAWARHKQQDRGERKQLMQRLHHLVKTNRRLMLRIKDLKQRDANEQAEIRELEKKLEERNESKHKLARNEKQDLAVLRLLRLEHHDTLDLMVKSMVDSEKELRRQQHLVQARITAFCSVIFMHVLQTQTIHYVVPCCAMLCCIDCSTCCRNESGKMRLARSTARSRLVTMQLFVDCPSKRYWKP